MSQPILQVVIPAYGESPYLKETLESAVKNLSSAVKIVVLEDPSDKKNIADIVKNFSDRVEYQINPTRLGIAGNFNKAIEISQAKFTLICGSDDLILGDLSHELENLEADSYAAVTSKNEIIDARGSKIAPLPDIVKKLISPKFKKPQPYKNKKFFNYLMLGDWMYFPSIAWNTEILRKEKFSDQFHTAMDLDIFVRLIEKNYKIYHFPVTKFAYRRHQQSASSIYANETGRFKEELSCHKYALQVASAKHWRLSRLLAQLAITVRLHGILKAISWALKFKFKPARELMAISLIRLTSPRLEI